MNIKKGKLIAIEPKDISKGMIVYHPNYPTGPSTFKVGKIDDYIELLNNNKVIDMIPLNDITELKELVVEYKKCESIGGRYNEITCTTTRIPLNCDYWAEALKDGLIDKEIDFEMIDAMGMTNHNPYTSIANIIYLKEEINNNVSDEIIKEIINSLDLYGRNIDILDYGLPIENHIDDMTNVVRDILNK